MERASVNDGTSSALLMGPASSDAAFASAVSDGAFHAGVQSASLSRGSVGNGRDSVGMSRSSVGTGNKPKRSSVRTQFRSSTTILESMQKRQSVRGDNDKTLEMLKKTRSASQVVEKMKMAKPPEAAGWKGEFLQSTGFQIAMGVAIALNAILIGCETDFPGLDILEWFELGFLIVFLIELCLRLIVFGPAVYFNPDNPDVIWNVFDVGIVASGVIGTVGTETGMINSGSGGLPTLLRVIRLLRIFRIFRLVRFLKQLYLLVYGFFVASIATVWVTILALVMLYVCAIIAVKLRKGVPHTDQSYPVLEAKFSTIGPTMFTLFELMLNPDIAPYENILGRHLLLTLFLIAFVVFGSFGMVALLTGVISEAMFEKNAAKDEEDRTEREERRKLLSETSANLFEEFLALTEVGSKGSFHLVEIEKQKVLDQKPRMLEVFAKKGFHFTVFDLEEVLTHVDIDDSGNISKSEFVNAIARLSEGVQAATILELHQVIQANALQTHKNIGKAREMVDARGRRFNLNIMEMLEKCKVFEESVDAMLQLFDPPEDKSKQELQKASESPDLLTPVVKAHSPTPFASLDLTPLPLPEDDTIDTSKEESSFVQSRLGSKVDALEAMVREMHIKLDLLVKRLRAGLPPQFRKKTSRQSAQAVSPKLSGKRVEEPAEMTWDAFDFQAPLDPEDIPSRGHQKLWLEESQDLLVPIPSN